MYMPSCLCVCIYVCVFVRVCPCVCLGERGPKPKQRRDQTEGKFSAPLNASNRSYMCLVETFFWTIYKAFSFKVLHKEPVFFSVRTRGNAVPTPFLPRLCLLVYFKCILYQYALYE